MSEDERAKWLAGVRPGDWVREHNVRGPQIDHPALVCYVGDGLIDVYARDDRYLMSYRASDGLRSFDPRHDAADWRLEPALPKPQTHWPGCWRDHHDCAVAAVRELCAALDTALAYGDTHYFRCASFHPPAGCDCYRKEANEVLNRYEEPTGDLPRDERGK